MSIVTLITDFGTKDFYAGALKGAILSQGSPAIIVDISHNIEPFNITEAAFVLLNAYPNFPEGTIHIVSVNDLDMKDSRFILIKHQGHFFLGLDNGIFSLVFDHPDEIYEVNNIGQNGQVNTLPGSDVYAGAVAKIIKGTQPSGIGQLVQTMKERTNLVPVVQDSLIRGAVIYVDSFKNVILNVKKDLFNDIGHGRKFVISFKRNERIQQISDGYHDVPEGEKVCLFNANDFMEIAINSGKAGSLLGLGIGDVVQIDFE